MENMQYAEELVREFLVFRGFTNSLQAFEKELSTDIGKGFEVDKILDLIFSEYIPKFQAENLVNLLSFFKQCFSSSETELLAALSKLDVSVLRYYIIYAIQSRRTDKVMEFFDTYGNDLLQKDQEWASWFAIPYIKKPQLDPHFCLFFSKDWYNALRLSVGNLLSGMLDNNRIPALLKISSERNAVNRLKKDVKQLNLKLSELQALLEEKEAQLCLLRSNASLSAEVGIRRTNSSSHSEVGTAEQVIRSPRVSHELHVSANSDPSKRDSFEHLAGTLPAEALDPCSRVDSHPGESEQSHDFQISQGDFAGETDGEIQKDEEFPEVKVEFQETFLGHTSPISRCRFSASGDNIASASVDGTVRIWTYDSSVPTSRNATIYCGAEVLSLEWECKSDRLLLIGTADGGIKAWNVDAKRVVCDLNSTKAFPSVLDIKCSPVEPIFVSASASRGHGTNAIDRLGFASLTVWNMRTWKAMSFLLVKIHQQSLHCVSIIMGSF